MRRTFLLKSMLLLCALVAGGSSVWGVEGDTHDFPQTTSVLLNNSASIDEINIAEQAYPVKEVIISYTHNKSLTGDFVTATVSVDGSSWGSNALTCNTTTTSSFTGTSATGAIVISFVNHRTASSKQGTFQVTNVRLVEGVADAPNQVKKPTITIPSGPFVSTKAVTISTETDGADIFYTTNGDEPTSTSTKYTAPFAISSTTTIKAIAVKNEMIDSHITTATFTKETVLDGIAGLKNSTTTGTATTYYVNLTNAQITYASGTTGYIEDATTGFYVYGPTVTLNKVYNGIFEIESKLYYSNPQITALAVVEGEGTITDGSAKAPTDITLSELEENFNSNLGRQMKISGALISSGPKIGTINVNDIGENTITAGKGYDLVGYPSVYNSGKRFNVVSAVNVPIAPTITVTDQSIACGSTFTVDDSKITGGAITVTSANTAVATVSGLVITGQSVGTVTITVSTAATEDFNAGSETFVLTITAPEGKATKPSGASVIEFDFTTNDDWGIPTQETSTDASYTSGSYTFDVSGSHYFQSTNNYFMLKYPGSLTFPAFDKKVTKIEVVGKSGASSGTKENIYVGTNAVSTENTGSAGTNTFEINENYQEIGTIYTLKVSEKNAQITAINVTTTENVVAPKLTLSATGYASYCSEYPLDFATANSDFKAYYVSNVDGATVTFTEITGKIKGGQGIILYGTPGAECQLAYADSDTELASNKLVGTLAPTYITTVNGDYTNFGLSGGKFVKIDNGTLPANKAYLPVLTANLPTSAPTFSIVFDDATGISRVENVQVANDQYYDLQGRRVAQPTKGLYIVNGRKVVVK